jgi:Na+-driven multidrug efflux pump
MLSTAIRQIVILIPCIIILGKIGGLNYVWFAFWISEVCAFLFSTFQLKKYIAMLKKYDN